jgi:hypothetical protein
MVDQDTIRRLAELKLGDGAVISLYVNLDPSAGFATAEARSTAFNSALDEAEREVEARDGLPHDARMTLREDVRQLREHLQRTGFLQRGGFAGARGLAVFRSGAADLLETIPLPYPVQSRVVIDQSPFVEPLLGAADTTTWGLLLVNRRTARLFRGSRERLQEVRAVRDNVHGQHDQGGWSQLRYQRSVEKDVADHLKHAAEVVRREFALAPFEHLLLGGPNELMGDVEATLHPDLRQRLAGRIEVDVENSNEADVTRAAGPALERAEREAERAAIDRILAGVGANGRGAAGLAEVLDALNQRRVEVLAYEDGYSEPGGVCPQCAWMGPVGPAKCPADGTKVQHREDMTEPAVESAIAQSARVVVVRHHPDLGPLGRIAAALRF